MEKEFYFSKDELKQFGNITEFQEVMGKKFFDYYGEVMQKGALTAREKSLIASVLLLAGVFFIVSKKKTEAPGTSAP